MDFRNHRIPVLQVGFKVNPVANCHRVCVLNVPDPELPFKPAVQGAAVIKAHPDPATGGFYDNSFQKSGKVIVFLYRFSHIPDTIRAIFENAELFDQNLAHD
jgi:hypothetical protein